MLGPPRCDIQRVNTNPGVKSRSGRLVREDSLVFVVALAALVMAVMFG